MKIGIDARNLVRPPTGIGRYLIEMTRALAAGGCDVVLFLPEPPHEMPADLAGFARVCGAWRGGALRTLWGHTALPRAARRERIDVFWGPAHRLPGRLDPAIARVLTIHDLVWLRAPETMRRRGLVSERLQMGPAIRSADRIVTVSRAIADDVTARFPFVRERIAIIHSGVNRLPREGGEAVFGRCAIDRPYALFVGTLEPRKNLFSLLSAYGRLPASVRGDLLLVLAGEYGWRLGDIEAHARSLGIDGQVRLAGRVDDAELGALYRKARLLAMPSLYEGFGFPIVEANAFGVPALTSNTGATAEIGGDAALLVDPHNVDDIAGGLAHLATDDALHARLAGAAKANAARFDWHASAARLVAVFKAAIGERRQ